jgi:hypothetical protein
VTNWDLREGPGYFAGPLVARRSLDLCGNSKRAPAEASVLSRNHVIVPKTCISVDWATRLNGRARQQASKEHSP